MKNKSRDSILIGIPTYDFRVDAVLAQALLACTEFFSEMPIIQGGNALIQLARNEIAHYFLHRTKCEWLMCIDSDIRFRREDWRLLWEGDEEEIVCAEYSYKYLDMIPHVKLGLGFTRIHRDVFDRIANLRTEDGQDTARRFYHKGEMMVDFFAQHVSSEGKFRPEDYGFFMWAHAVEANTRIENRTRLGHVGQMCFDYPYKIAPETIAKMMHVDTEFGAKVHAALFQMDGATQ